MRKRPIQHHPFNVPRLLDLHIINTGIARGREYAEALNNHVFPDFLRAISKMATILWQLLYMLCSQQVGCCLIYFMRITLAKKLRRDHRFYISI